MSKLKNVLNTLMTTCFIFCMGGTVNAAEIINDDNVTTAIVKNADRIQHFFSHLLLPEQTGEFLTGKTHTYKLFVDTTKTMTIYCDKDSANGQCVFSINKALGRAHKNLSEESDNVRLSLTNPDDTLALLEALDVGSMIHGDYAIKALVGNDEEPFAVNCYVNMKNPEERACSLVIFFN